VEVLLVDLFGQIAVIEVYNDDVMLFLGLLVATNILAMLNVKI